LFFIPFAGLRRIDDILKMRCAFFTSP